MRSVATPAGSTRSFRTSWSGRAECGALCRLTLTVAAFAGIASRAGAAFGQDAPAPPGADPAHQQVSATASAPSTSATPELPPSVRASLGQIRDYAFDFDQAGFYAVAEHLKRSGAVPGSDEPPTVIDDWRVFAEQPNDLRGHPVTITGMVGHNRGWTLRNRPQLGGFWQVELFDKRQPIACTVVFTQIAEDVPIDASISVTGYFVMMRSYYDKNNQPRHAALLVAPGPTSISRPGGGGSRDSFLAQPNALFWTFGAMGVGLIVALFLLRRATSRPASAFEALRARGTPAGDADFERWIGDAAGPQLSGDAASPSTEPPRAADSKS